MKSPIAGGVGAMAGSATLNKHLMAKQLDEERTHRTRDAGTQGMHHLQYPSMYDLARAMTAGKWGNSSKS